VYPVKVYGEHVPTGVSDSTGEGEFVRAETQVLQRESHL